VDREELKVSKAKLISDKLRIPLLIVDCKELFHEKVVKYFLEQYQKGYTPNPCVRCNQMVKFPIITKIAKENLINLISTGHYVRIFRHKDHSFLVRAKDKSKDQSYFLSMIPNEILNRCIFPLGEFEKGLVLKEVMKSNLFASPPKESQEVCFLSGRDYRELFLYSLPGSQEGPIVDMEGKVLGRHKGIFNYTIGQRKGLGIAFGEPLYVREIRYRENQIVVAPKEGILRREVPLGEIHWKVRFRNLLKAMRISGQIRYKQLAAPGRLILGERNRFFYDSPQWAITPGQAFVGYRCDILLMASFIERDEG
ncbi:MAG: tRNA 2-thiouridine(34) synthase MnmA, partial [Desulfatiglandales bacterium]